MGVSFEIKQRDDKGHWHRVPLSDFVGKSVSAVLAQYEGKAVVAEFIFDGQKFYFCGTDYWCQQMKEKGAKGAVLFSEVPYILKKKKRLDVLAEIIDGAADVVGVFEGAEHIKTEVA